ncbi:hypothetical protein MCEMSEM23_02521 [Rhabdaerophilaceae bacterium]
MLADQASSSENTMWDFAINTGIYRDLEGTIDMHVHPNPDFCARLLDDRDLVALAKATKMRALMIKSHAGPTADRAYIAEKAVGGGIKVFGLICLNPSVGGFNPAAVKLAIKSGVRGIWMPSMWSENHASYVRKEGAGMGYQTIGMEFPPEGSGLSILDANGAIKRDVLTILDMTAEADLMLATGHLGLDEVHVLLSEAKKRAMTKLVVHTANYHVMKFPLTDLKQMAFDYGAVLEMGFSSLPNGIWDPLDRGRLIGVKEVAEMIRAVGPENCVCTTDCGQFSTPMPIEAMRLWISHLRSQGFSQGEIDQMTKHVPARLLGME